MKRLAVALAVAIVATGAAQRASAQEYLPSASVQVASGVEGAGGDAHRARTRLRIGLELRIDESPADGVTFAGLVDLEPHAAFGADLRYVRSLGKTFDASGGAIAYLAPGTLLGPAAGLTGKVPFASKASVLVGPDVAVFVFGSDLPNNTIVWQALLQVGLRADF